MTFRRRRGLVAAGVASLVAVTGACTDDGADPGPDSTSSTSTTVVAPVDDGVLQMGVLLPSSGEGASIGQTARAAIRVAVNRVNAAGGVGGAPVELIFRDEGGDVDSAELALQRLIESNVDVIVGPASSNTAIALVPAMVQAGIAACSPSASALALDDLPDRGLFFRSIPSDRLQADAIAEVVERTGQTSAAITYVDDGYGRPFEQALRAALQRRGITVALSLGYTVDDEEFATEAARLADPGSAIVILGDAESGSRMLAAVASAVREQPRTIVVNDALRVPWSRGLLNAVDAPVRERVVGVSPVVQTDDEELLHAIEQQDDTAADVFAAQAYDCANLFLLAAVQASSTLPATLAAAVPSISAGGSPCAAFDDCAALLAQGRNIDYNGPTGVLSLGATGDPSLAVFDQFGFDETGRDVSLTQVVVDRSSS